MERQKTRCMVETRRRRLALTPSNTASGALNAIRMRPDERQRNFARGHLSCSSAPNVLIDLRLSPAGILYRDATGTKTPQPEEKTKGCDTPISILDRNSSPASLPTASYTSTGPADFICPRGWEVARG